MFHNIGRKLKGIGYGVCIIGLLGICVGVMMLLSAAVDLLPNKQPLITMGIYFAAAGATLLLCSFFVYGFGELVENSRITADLLKRMDRRESAGADNRPGVSEPARNHAKPEPPRKPEKHGKPEEPRKPEAHDEPEALEAKPDSENRRSARWQEGPEQNDPEPESPKPETPAPAPIRRNSTWQCKECGMIHPALRRVCWECGTAKPEEEGTQETSAS